MFEDILNGAVILENMQKQGEMHCDTEIVILIGISEYIFKMLLENGIGYKKPPD